MGHVRLALIFSLLVLASACKKSDQSGPNNQSTGTRLRIVGLKGYYSNTRNATKYSYDDDNPDLPVGFSEDTFYDCQPGTYNYAFDWTIYYNPYMIPPTTPRDVALEARGRYALQSSPKGLDYTAYFSLERPGTGGQSAYTATLARTETSVRYQKNALVGTQVFGPDSLCPFVLKVKGELPLDAAMGKTFFRLVNKSGNAHAPWVDNIPVTPMHYGSLDTVMFGGEEPYELNKYYGPLPQLPTARYTLGGSFYSDIKDGDGNWIQDGFAEFTTEPGKDRYYTFEILPNGPLGPRGVLRWSYTP